MSAVVIPFGPMRTPAQPRRRKLTKAEIAERVRLLAWLARDWDMEITIHGPVKEARV